MIYLLSVQNLIFESIKNTHVFQLEFFIDVTCDGLCDMTDDIKKREW